jgi:hypothetical protein
VLRRLVGGNKWEIHVSWVTCHHGMARPQVADGGSPPGAEGSFKYIE